MPRGINYYFIPFPQEHKDRRQSAIDEVLSQLRLREVGKGLFMYGLPERCRALFDALEPYLVRLSRHITYTSSPRYCRWRNAANGPAKMARF